MTAIEHQCPHCDWVGAAHPLSLPHHIEAMHKDSSFEQSRARRITKAVALLTKEGYRVVKLTSVGSINPDSTADWERFTPGSLYQIEEERNAD